MIADAVGLGGAAVEPRAGAGPPPEERPCDGAAGSGLVSRARARRPSPQRWPRPRRASARLVGADPDATGSPTFRSASEITVGTFPCQRRKIVESPTANVWARGFPHQQAQRPHVAAAHVDGDAGRADGGDLPAEEVQRACSAGSAPCRGRRSGRRGVLDRVERRAARGADVHPHVVAGVEIAGVDDRRNAVRPLEELGVVAVGERLRDRLAEQRAEGGPFPPSTEIETWPSAGDAVSLPRKE